MVPRHVIPILTDVKSIKSPAKTQGIIMNPLMWNNSVLILSLYSSGARDWISTLLVVLNADCPKDINAIKKNARGAQVELAYRITATDPNIAAPSTMYPFLIM